MAPYSSTLAWKIHGQRSLVGCSPWGCEESDTTERLHFHFSFSCIGEGNGNPLQCSCLENPRDRGAWWAAVYGVTQSRTRLKRLSSSNSSSPLIYIQRDLCSYFLTYCLYNIETSSLTWRNWKKKYSLWSWRSTQAFWEKSWQFPPVSKSLKKKYSESFITPHLIIVSQNWQ